MLFGLVSSGVKARRVLGQLQVPWNLAGLFLVLLLLLAVETSVPSVMFPLGETSNPVAVSQQSAGQSEQRVTVVAVPITECTEWPKIQVMWSEPFPINSLTDLPPSLPAGKGFYRETPDGIANGHSSKEAEAYFRKILPCFGPFDTTLVPVEAIAGIARDPANPGVVLAGFHKGYVNPNSRVGERDGEAYGFLFLSIDRERSWYEIFSFVPEPWRNSLVDVRVAKDENKLILLARDPYFVAPMWRKATLSLKDLP